MDMIVLERTLRDGLAQIHALGVAHGDIEMRNIVVDDSDGSLEAKFIDFGNSVVLKDDRSNAAQVHQQQQQDLLSLNDALTSAKAWIVDQTQGECEANGSCAIIPRRVEGSGKTSGRVVLDGSLDRDYLVDTAAQSLIVASSTPSQIQASKNAATKQLRDNVIR
jgi:serine/threonine protein kinase